MNNKGLYGLVGVAFFALAANCFAAQQQILTIESTITGSQEQPRVISIVPWQSIKEPEYLGKDIELGIPSAVFDTIDRDSFNRELKYINATNKK